MRYEVYETRRGETRIIATVRRENAAINERDIAAESCWSNYRRHAETGGAVVWADHEADSRATTVTYVDALATVVHVFGYRRVGEAEDWRNVDLVPALLASLYAIGAVKL